jgi:hypothetical protein
MPGGTVDGYNEGMIAAHEKGHWLGLLRVFEGYSCTGKRDFVDDTPMQSTSTDDCPTSPPKKQLTKPARGRSDPYHHRLLNG